MGRNNNSTLSDGSERSSSKRRTEQSEQEKNRPGNLIKDPVRCPLCLAKLMCPRNKDYEEFLDQKLMKCLLSKEETCIRAVASPRNADFIKRTQLRVKQHDPSV